MCSFFSCVVHKPPYVENICEGSILIGESETQMCSRTKEENQAH